MGITATTWGEKIAAGHKDAQRVKPAKAGDLAQLKAMYAATEGSGGAAVEPGRRLRISTRVPARPLTVLDLISIEPTTSDLVEYVEIATRDNQAEIAPEYTGGNFGLKAESNFTFEGKEANVKYVANWIGASKTILADAPRLESAIDGWLSENVREALENQVVAGDGTGDNFQGITTHPDIQTRTHQVSGARFNAADKIGDTLRRAITDIQLKHVEPDGILMHPVDYEKLALEKGSTGGAYLYIERAGELFAVPCVATTIMTQGTALVGAFRLGAVLFDREGVTILTGEPNDFFLRNAVALLAEARAGFATVFPEGFCLVSGL